MGGKPRPTGYVICLLILSAFVGIGLHTYAQFPERHESQAPVPSDVQAAAQTIPDRIDLANAILTTTSRDLLTDADLLSVNVSREVFTTSLQGFPTNGSSYILLSTGIAENAPGQAADFESINVNGPSEIGGSPDGFDAFDLTRFLVELSIPMNAQFASFDFKFCTEENPTFLGSQFQDYFIANASIKGSTSPRNIAILPDNNIVNVDNAAAFSNAVGGASENPTAPFPSPNDVVYNACTDKLTASIDVSNSGGQTLRLLFEIGDASDAILDSAVLIDNLKFVSSKSIAEKRDLINELTHLEVCFDILFNIVQLDLPAISYQEKEAKDFLSEIESQTPFDPSQIAALKRLNLAEQVLKDIYLGSQGKCADGAAIIADDVASSLAGLVGMALEAKRVFDELAKGLSIIPLIGNKLADLANAAGTKLFNIMFEAIQDGATLMNEFCPEKGICEEVTRYVSSEALTSIRASIEALTKPRDFVSGGLIEDTVRLVANEAIVTPLYVRLLTQDDLNKAVKLAQNQDFSGSLNRSLKITNTLTDNAHQNISNKHNTFDMASKIADIARAVGTISDIVALVPAAGQIAAIVGAVSKGVAVGSYITVIGDGGGLLFFTLPDTVSEGVKASFHPGLVTTSSVSSNAGQSTTVASNAARSGMVSAAQLNTLQASASQLNAFLKQLVSLIKAGDEKAVVNGADELLALDQKFSSELRSTMESIRTSSRDAFGEAPNFKALFLKLGRSRTESMFDRATLFGFLAEFIQSVSGAGVSAVSLSTSASSPEKKLLNQIELVIKSNNEVVKVVGEVEASISSTRLVQIPMLTQWGLVLVTVLMMSLLIFKLWRNTNLTGGNGRRG